MSKVNPCMGQKLQGTYIGCGLPYNLINEIMVSSWSHTIVSDCKNLIVGNWQAEVKHAFGKPALVQIS